MIRISEFYLLKPLYLTINIQVFCLVLCACCVYSQGHLNTLLHRLQSYGFFVPVVFWPFSLLTFGLCFCVNFGDIELKFCVVANIHPLDNSQNVKTIAWKQRFPPFNFLIINSMIWALFAMFNPCIL